MKNAFKKYAYKTVASPMGVLYLVATDTGVAAIMWGIKSARGLPFKDLEEKTDHPLLLQLQAQLREYFAGERTRFEVPLDMQGTEFQKRVWQGLLKIPYGKTFSYKDLATAVGNPKASRAVGMANSKNPIGIVVPCHRVIGANGSLTGYAGGLNNKSYLLNLERETAGTSA